MKKALVIITLVILLLTTMSCVSLGTSSSAADSPNTKVETPEISEPFEMELIKKQKIDSDIAFYFYKETITDVVYVRCLQKAGYAGAGGLTVLSDPETGLPLTYARYIEIYNNQVEIKE